MNYSKGAYVKGVGLRIRSWGIFLKNIHSVKILLFGIVIFISSGWDFNKPQDNGKKIHKVQVIHPAIDKEKPVSRNLVEVLPTTNKQREYYIVSARKPALFRL